MITTVMLQHDSACFVYSMAVGDGVAGSALAAPVLAVCMRVVEGGRPQFDFVAMDTQVVVGKLVKLLAIMPAINAENERSF